MEDKTYDEYMEFETMRELFDKLFGICSDMRNAIDTRVVLDKYHTAREVIEKSILSNLSACCQVKMTSIVNKKIAQIREAELKTAFPNLTKFSESGRK